MKKLEIAPEGWPRTLEECPSGHFLWKDQLCFKSEYRKHGNVDAYCESGEYFWGGTDNHTAQAQLIVQPVVAVWKDTDKTTDASH